MSEKYVVDEESLVPYEDYYKSHPHGNCDECSKEYGTLGCCSTVSNKWIYNCERGMTEYAYNKGFKDGMEEAKTQAELDVAHDIENVAKSNYQKGLSDAWECAKKIDCLPRDGGLSGIALDDIFNTDSPCAIMKDFSASEALKKIREYEENKNKIRVGDEVKDNDEGYRGIVTYVYNTAKVDVLWDDGSVGELVAIDDLTKTGRAFPQIEDILNEMSEEE